MMANSFSWTSVPEALGSNTLGLLLRVFPGFADFPGLEAFAVGFGLSVPEAFAVELAATGLSAGALPAVALSPEHPQNIALDRNKIHRDNEIDFRII